MWGAPLHTFALHWILPLACIQMSAKPIVLSLLACLFLVSGSVVLVKASKVFPSSKVSMTAHLRELFAWEVFSRMCRVTVDNSERPYQKTTDRPLAGRTYNKLQDFGEYWDLFLVAVQSERNYRSCPFLLNLLLNNERTEPEAAKANMASYEVWDTNSS